MAGKIDARLAELGINIPDAPAPAANYVPYVTTGNLVIVSGQVPFVDGKLRVTGHMGDGTVTEEQAVAEARQCAINLIAQVVLATGGDLDRVKRVCQAWRFCCLYT